MVDAFHACALRVFIVERQALFARALAALLSLDRDLTVVGEVRSVECDQLAGLAPDVVVVDVDADDGALLALAAAIGAKRIKTRILALSSHLLPDLMQRCFARGAEGFVGKDLDPSEFVRAVKAVGNGSGYVDPRGGSLLMALRRQDRLTVRETDVLRLVGSGLSNKEIGAKLGVAEKTVKSHVSSILAKLQTDGRTQAAVHALRIGLL